MAHAEVCPVCEGTGLKPDTKSKDGETLWTVNCNGCDGRGWVTVPDEKLKQDEPPEEMDEEALQAMRISKEIDDLLKPKYPLPHAIWRIPMWWEVRYPWEVQYPQIWCKTKTTGGTE